MSRLTQAGIEFEINPRLVRGLDYYNRNVFEWVTDSLEPKVQCVLEAVAMVW